MKMLVGRTVKMENIKPSVKSKWPVRTGPKAIVPDTDESMLAVLPVGAEHRPAAREATSCELVLGPEAKQRGARQNRTKQTGPSNAEQGRAAKDGRPGPTTACKSGAEESMLDGESTRWEGKKPQ